MAFIQYTQRFFRPISDLSEKYNILQQAMASARAHLRPARHAGRPGRGAARESGRRRGAGAGPARGFRGRIEFDGVTFAYDGETRVLEDVSFTVEPGEKVALVGATGSGKTTTVSLLLGFYQPQGGVIRVDGRPLGEWDMHELRRHVGLVLQDPFLFSGSDRREPRARRRRTCRARPWWRAAREVHADRFIERLPGGYDAEVHERGATFSAGERQLLAFARALAADPSVLVLDEATSSVDTQTEALIQDGLRRLMRGRTSLVIAHRLSTIQDVDRIVVLHHGRVREIGTHAELLARGGIYARLYQLQYLGRPQPAGPPAAPERPGGARAAFPARRGLPGPGARETGRTARIPVACIQAALLRPPIPRGDRDHAARQEDPGPSPAPWPDGAAARRRDRPVEGLHQPGRERPHLARRSPRWRDLAAALRTSVSYLVADDEPTPHVVRAAERPLLDIGDDDARGSRCCRRCRGATSSCSCSSCRRARPGEARAHSYDGEECLLCLEGRVLLLQGDRSTCSSPATPATSTAASRTRSENGGAGTARLLVAMTPAAFGQRRREETAERSGAGPVPSPAPTR